MSLYTGILKACKRNGIQINDRVREAAETLCDAIECENDRMGDEYDASSIDED